MFIKKSRQRKSQFIPKNTDKYIGTYPIVCRSEWERMVCQWLDRNNNVIKWSSENTVIPNYDPVQMKKRRYYPDFFAEMKTKNGSVKYIIEVKPHKETVPPVKKGKKTSKTKLFQEATYLTNMAKFKAAEQYCSKLNYKFKVLTEKQLFRKGRR